MKKYIETIKLFIRYDIFYRIMDSNIIDYLLRYLHIREPANVITYTLPSYIPKTSNIGIEEKVLFMYMDQLDKFFETFERPSKENNYEGSVETYDKFKEIHNWFNNEYKAKFIKLNELCNTLKIFNSPEINIKDNKVVLTYYSDDERNRIEGIIEYIESIENDIEKKETEYLRYLITYRYYFM